MPDEGHVDRGWWFPSEAMVPDDTYWYRMDFADSVQWDMDRDGHVLAARRYEDGQLKSIRSEVAETGSVDAVLHAAVECEVNFGGQTWRAVAGADSTSDQVRDPEHVWSVAETRAIKRALKRALGIRPVDQSRDEAAQEASEDTDVSVPEGGPEEPPSQWDDFDEGADDGW